MSRRAAAIMGGWRLWRATLAEFAAHWRRYLGAGLIVSVPILAISLLPGNATSSLGSSNSSLSDVRAYGNVASVILNVAILALVAGRRRNMTLAQAFYDGTAPLVRYVLASAGVALCLLPAAAGLLIAAAGTGPNSSGGEAVIVGLFGLIIALPSLWLLVRFALAPVLVVVSDLRPIAALKTARRLTLGRFWTVVARYIIMALWLILIAVIISAIVALLGLIWHSQDVTTAVLSFALGLVILPLSSIYLVMLAEQLIDHTV